MLSSSLEQEYHMSFLMGEQRLLPIGFVIDPREICVARVAFIGMHHFVL